VSASNFAGHSSSTGSKFFKHFAILGDAIGIANSAKKVYYNPTIPNVLNLGADVLIARYGGAKLKIANNILDISG
jgi:hypothetical protein